MMALNKQQATSNEFSGAIVAVVAIVAGCWLLVVDG